MFYIFWKLLFQRIIWAIKKTLFEHPKRRQIFASTVGRICKLNLTLRPKVSFKLRVTRSSYGIYYKKWHLFDVNGLMSIRKRSVYDPDYRAWRVEPNCKEKIRNISKLTKSCQTKSSKIFLTVQDLKGLKLFHVRVAATLLCKVLATPKVNRIKTENYQ